MYYFNEDFGFPAIQSSQLWNAIQRNLTLTFTVPTTAVSLNVATWDSPEGKDGGTIIVVTDLGSEVFGFSTLNNNPGFWGFTSSSGNIQKLILEGPDQTVGVDNITLSTVPEPSTYALLLGCGTLLAAAVRRRAMSRKAVGE